MKLSFFQSPNKLYIVNSQIVNLSASLQSATLAAVVATVIIEFNLDIGFLQLLPGDEAELEVLNAQPSVEPLLLVIGADIKF